jgi:OmpA-OmpF porin, OOP family
MRACLAILLGAAVMTSIATQSIGPAHADPAYTADKLIAIFVKDKAATQAAKVGKTRGYHWKDNNTETDAAVSPPPVHHVDLLVNFEFDSNKLTGSTKENLAQFASALQDPRIKGTKFEIEGHTDATGTEQYNIGLSERRANAVIAYLVSLGVDPSTLEAKGYGKSKPRVADPFSAENRRVETHLAE